MTYTIRTLYYRGKELVKQTHSRYASNAVPNAVGHMQLRHYDATACEVFDVATGELHAVLRLKIASDALEILFKREVKEGE